MARDDSPASSMAPASSTVAAAAQRPMRGKVGSEFETEISYNAPMHFRHRWTDGLASWHKREMYILHLALINGEGTAVEYIGQSADGPIGLN